MLLAYDEGFQLLIFGQESNSSQSVKQLCDIAVMGRWIGRVVAASGIHVMPFTAREAVIGRGEDDGQRKILQTNRHAPALTAYLG